MITETDDSWGDPGYCPDCKKPHEWVRPGKTQPTCECHLICGECGQHYGYFTEANPNPLSPNHYGEYCAPCQAKLEAWCDEQEGPDEQLYDERDI